MKSMPSEVNAIDYNSPAALKAFLDKNGMAMQKRFGQNFMINKSARERIIEALELKTGAYVWEIGGGLGALTAAALKKGARLKVFEIDRGFVKILKDIFAADIENGRLEIAEGDVLKLWGEAYRKEKSPPVKIFGNLPYNIASSFIGAAIEQNAAFEMCVFTVQKEVAERMRAAPASKTYSAFSVLCQVRYNIKSLMVLSPGSFWPRPEVASETVIMTKKEGASLPPHFAECVHLLFGARRKTLYNNLKDILSEAGCDARVFFRECGADSSERAENLSVAQIEGIAKQLSQMLKY